MEPDASVLLPSRGRWEYCSPRLSKPNSSGRFLSFRGAPRLCPAWGLCIPVTGKDISTESDFSFIRGPALGPLCSF